MLPLNQKPVVIILSMASMAKAQVRARSILLSTSFVSLYESSSGCSKARVIVLPMIIRIIKTSKQKLYLIALHIFLTGLSSPKI